MCIEDRGGSFIMHCTHSNIRLKSFHYEDLLDAKEMVKVYDLKSDKVVYGIGRWEFLVCDTDLYLSLSDRSVSYLGVERTDSGEVYLAIYLGKD